MYGARTRQAERRRLCGVLESTTPANVSHWNSGRRLPRRLQSSTQDRSPQPQEPDSCARRRGGSSIRTTSLTKRSFIDHEVPIPEFDDSMRALRKLLSILLLAMFGMPFVSPLMAQSAMGDAGLPACCRRDGRRHCIPSLRQREKFSPNSAAFCSPIEKCPYCPASLAISHGDLFTVPTTQAVYAPLIAHPNGVAQTESKHRISRDRSRRKRGPPTLSLL
jgi:hypothetical protein